MFWLRNKKHNFLLRTLIWGLACHLINTCTKCCVSNCGAIEKVKGQTACQALASFAFSVRCAEKEPIIISIFGIFGQSEQSKYGFHFNTFDC